MFLHFFQSGKNQTIFNDDNGQDENAACFCTNLTTHKDFVDTWYKKDVEGLDIIRGDKLKQA